MFRLITAEFNRMLGNDFVLYFSENETSPFRREIVNNGKIGGIVRVEGGSVKPIEGFSGLEAEGVIEFLVETSIPNLEDKVTTLIETSNGVIKSEGTAFQYLINYGVLAPTGDMQRMSGERATKDFLIWRLPFSIVLSEKLEFGNEVVILISRYPIPESTVGYELTGVMNSSLDLLGVVIENNRIGRDVGTLKRKNAFRKMTIDLIKDGSFNQNMLFSEIKFPGPGLYLRRGDVDLFMQVENITDVAPKGGFRTARIVFAETAPNDGFSKL